MLEMGLAAAIGLFSGVFGAWLAHRKLADEEYDELLVRVKRWLMDREIAQKAVVGQAARREKDDRVKGLKGQVIAAAVSGDAEKLKSIAAENMDLLDEMMK